MKKYKIEYSDCEIELKNLSDILNATYSDYESAKEAIVYGIVDIISDNCYGYRATQSISKFEFILHFHTNEGDSPGGNHSQHMIKIVEIE